MFEAKVPVQHYQHQVPPKPMVSVCVITYNHENYIAQCLDGILMQQTDFQFEICLGEDNSTDKTREICVSYADRYPDKIRLFLHQRENVIHINGNATGRFNFMYNFEQANSKYIAVCEGDDYWTDSNKLQKQVNFLESNPTYMICGHRVDVVNDSGIKEGEKPEPFEQQMEFKHSMNQFILPTVSMVFRKTIIDESFYNLMRSSVIGDLIIKVCALSKGGGKQFNECLAAYRLSAVGIWSNRNRAERMKGLIDTHELIRKEFPIHTSYIENKTNRLRLDCCQALLKDNQPEKVKNVFNSIPLFGFIATSQNIKLSAKLFLTMIRNKIK